MDCQLKEKKKKKTEESLQKSLETRIVRGRDIYNLFLIESHHESQILTHILVNENKRCLSQTLELKKKEKRK